MLAIGFSEGDSQWDLHGHPRAGLRARVTIGSRCRHRRRRSTAMRARFTSTSPTRTASRASARPTRSGRARPRQRFHGQHRALGHGVRAGRDQHRVSEAAHSRVRRRRCHEAARRPARLDRRRSSRVRLGLSASASSSGRTTATAICRSSSRRRPRTPSSTSATSRWTSSGNGSAVRSYRAAAPMRSASSTTPGCASSVIWFPAGSSPSFPAIPLPGANWDDFKYIPSADERMVGMELFNGGTDYSARHGEAAGGNRAAAAEGDARGDRGLPAVRRRPGAACRRVAQGGRPGGGAGGAGGDRPDHRGPCLGPLGWRRARRVGGDRCLVVIDDLGSREAVVPAAPRGRREDGEEAQPCGH